MRILIFYASIGTGHLSAAKAIESALKKLRPGTEVILVDVFSSRRRQSGLPELLSALATVGFPGIYDWAWRTGAGRPIFDISCHLPNLRARVFSQYEQIRPDAIVCTHVLPCAILTRERKRRPTVPILGITTDFQANVFWPTQGINAYVVATEDAAHRLQQRGVLAGKIYAFGIPTQTQEDRPVQSEKSDGKLNILVIAGGNRVGPYLPVLLPVYRLGLRLATQPGEGIRWQFVLGSNRWLKERLEQVAGFQENLRISGMVNDVPERMRQADLIVTKPGGLTLAEAFAAGKPVLLLSKGAGEAAANVKATVSYGAGIVARTPEQIIFFAQRAREDTAFLETLRANATALGKPEAARKTAELIGSMVG